MTLKYEKLTLIPLRGHATLNEKWVQDRIAEDPQILGLGDVILKDRERNQPRAGRLDLLLQQADGNRRYEVEIQHNRYSTQNELTRPTEKPPLAVSQVNF